MSSFTPEKNFSPKPKNPLRPVWVTALFLTLSIALTFLFFRGFEGPSPFGANILVLTLVNVNITLSILLILLLSRNLIKLYFERRRQPMKSSFKSKLVAAFIGLSMIPSILLFIVASGLLTSSIENWFSIQVEKSLDHALEIAQDYYQNGQDTVLVYSRQVGQTLLEKNLLEGPHEELLQFLNTARREYRVQGIRLFTPGLQEFASAPPHSDFPPSPVLSPVSPDLFQRAGRSLQPIASVSSIAGGDLIRGVLPLQADHRVVAFLVVDQLIPPLLVGKMEEIKKSLEEYKQLKAFKNPIKGSYILSFFIIVLLIIFSATWFGFYIARGITVPIQKLAEGTQAVAQGDLNFQIDVQATDELGVLVDSFNKMTADLKQSQEKVEDANRSLMVSNRELEARRAYMEGVLQNIGAGVISVDEKGVITTFNQSAEKILNARAEEAMGKDYAAFFSSRKMGMMADLLQKMQGLKKESMEEEAQLEVRKKFLTLRIALSTLKGNDGRPLGAVIVFDDLSELIRAQKLATWQEVARRIAHEIKNPLTPIQLSAERLRKKYYERSEDFHKIFDEATRIMISEVNSMKMLVDEFSNFARMPAPRPTLQRIEPIIKEVIALYQSAHKDIVVRSHFDEAAPPLNIDREQMKRVFMNLFENAMEAMNRQGTLMIATAYDAAQQKVYVEVTDDGVGIVPDDVDKLFLPYFSRKKTGTGLGLAIVNRIVLDHNGHIRVAPRQPNGTTFTIELSAGQA
ncbi:MAG TPA: ATP-binding protein [Candidatus Manganitrophaceae bacterium]|nr:ATP-binding protein [Candidatus Manganitrophaceae bacterium]